MWNCLVDWSNGACLIGLFYAVTGLLTMSHFQMRKGSHSIVGG